MAIYSNWCSSLVGDSEFLTSLGEPVYGEKERLDCGILSAGLYFHWKYHLDADARWV